MYTTVLEDLLILTICVCMYVYYCVFFHICIYYIFGVCVCVCVCVCWGSITLIFISYNHPILNVMLLS